MTILSPYSSSFLTTLFCNEQQPFDIDHGNENENEDEETTLIDSPDLHLKPFELDQQDLCWDHEELVSLFSKEKEQFTPCGFTFDKNGPSSFSARKEAVDWILKVKSYYGFTDLTAILAINYLDRFVSSLDFEKKDDRSWVIQLVSVTCLSLAAKLEETQVPLLLDLQVDDTKLLFEAKNIQNMELLVMSKLKWRMNPVTPVSFLDHIVRRLGLTNHLHWDFFNKCEALILCVVSDSRFMCYKPSVLATSTMLVVVDQIDSLNSIDYKSQLLDLLQTTKENVKECYELVLETSYDNQNKRESVERATTTYPVSPSGVIDFTCDESSSDSWEFCGHHLCEPSFKKMRINQQLGFGSLISIEPFVSPRYP